MGYSPQLCQDRQTILEAGLVDAWAGTGEEVMCSELMWSERRHGLEDSGPRSPLLDPEDAHGVIRGPVSPLPPIQGSWERWGSDLQPHQPQQVLRAE